MVKPVPTTEARKAPHATENAMGEIPVKFTVRHIGRSTIQEIEMDTTDKPDDYTLAENLQTVLSNTLKQPHWHTASDHLVTAPRPAPTLADAMALPEVAALVENAEWAFPILSDHLNHPNDQGDLEDFRAALAPFTAARGTKA
jgi:hypothetical protein